MKKKSRDGWEDLFVTNGMSRDFMNSDLGGKAKGRGDEGWRDKPVLKQVNLALRNLTIEDVAQKIGAGRRAVMDAEKGKPSTGIAIYVALLWVFDLLGPFEDVADPQSDAEGQALARSKERSRARIGGELDDDF